MRSWFQPVPDRGVEKPKPGTDGMTRWKSSRSGSMTSRNSTTDPGQPWVRMSGSASALGERTCSAWMRWPSIVVRNWAYALSLASQARQS
jgi:hypothetical protein